MRNLTKAEALKKLEEALQELDNLFHLFLKEKCTTPEEAMQILDTKYKNEADRLQNKITILRKIVNG